jgi:uncharacterized membrane protein YphA (DoxX/SURF4 family)
MDAASPTDATPVSGVAPTRASRGMLVLRLGLGALWAANLIYIFDPANQYWSGFAGAAQSFEGQSLGGGGFAQFVAIHPVFFAALIAGVSVYLAIAFLLGLSTRAACLIGGAFNLALFVTQWAQVSTIPGGTDVGTQPLYLAMYVALFLGYEANRFTLDYAVRGVWIRWRARNRPRPTTEPDAAGAPTVATRLLD